MYYIKEAFCQSFRDFQCFRKKFFFQPAAVILCCQLQTAAARTVRRGCAHMILGFHRPTAPYRHLLGPLLPPHNLNRTVESMTVFVFAISPYNFHVIPVTCQAPACARTLQFRAPGAHQTSGHCCDNAIRSICHHLRHI